MVRKMLAVLIALAVVVAFTLPALAQEAQSVKGKVDALDKEGKKVTIAGTEYDLSDEAAEAEVAEGDEVEATVDGTTVNSLTKAAAPAEGGE